jgi:hypothetical protein
MTVGCDESVRLEVKESFGVAVAGLDMRAFCSGSRVMTRPVT